eukprot:CAMPEP_0184014818 /NCGR_PEP_ID=MMETSP0954-20121128/5923_1 /TAXON_ID=627963 /ORGANISM="Aplanochytrium sp, Strain PBS07" /LENGTH=289 /DNA_ID=CAMNT_0026295447 /DNA_START=230 /DNA_END=1099 /DNA_ORIENTATION=+
MTAERMKKQYYEFVFDQLDYEKQLSHIISSHAFIEHIDSLELSLWIQTFNPQQYELLWRNPCVMSFYRVSLMHKASGEIVFSFSLKEVKRCAFGKHSEYQHGDVVTKMIQFWFIFICTCHFLLAMGRVLTGILVVRRLQRILHEFSHDSSVNPLNTLTVNADDAFSGFLDTERYPYMLRRTTHLSPMTDNESELLKNRRILWQDILAIVNVWVLVSALADVFVFAYAALQLNMSFSHVVVPEELSNSFISDTSAIILGSGCFLHLISLMEYAEYGFENYLFLQVSRFAR